MCMCEGKCTNESEYASECERCASKFLNSEKEKRTLECEDRKLLEQKFGVDIRQRKRVLLIKVGTKRT